MHDRHHQPDAGAPGASSDDHLDLVTAELRRRIAGIGLAIAELRQETGRLRSTADDRYHVVAVLDRSLPGADVAPDTDGPVVIAPPALVSQLAQPVPPWQGISAPIEASAGIARVASPEPVPSTPVVPSVTGPSGPTMTAPSETVWPELDDVDEAAFQAFFSAEVDPEPAQRWLLSD